MGAKGSGINREKERLAKINEILEMIQKKKQLKKKIIALVQLKFGTSRRTALEYVNVLIDAEKITEVEGILQKS